MRTGSFLNSSEKKLVQPSLANPFKLELPHSVIKLEHTRLSRNEGLGGETYKFSEFMTEKKPKRKQDNPSSFSQLSRTFEVISPSALIGYEGVPEKPPEEEVSKKEVKEEEKERKQERRSQLDKKEEEQIRWNISRKIRMFTK